MGRVGVWAGGGQEVKRRHWHAALESGFSSDSHAASSFSFRSSRSYASRKGLHDSGADQRTRHLIRRWNAQSDLTRIGKDLKDRYRILRRQPRRYLSGLTLR